jgi:hypothetical protein
MLPDAAFGKSHPAMFDDTVAYRPLKLNAKGLDRYFHKLPWNGRYCLQFSNDPRILSPTVEERSVFKENGQTQPYPALPSGRSVMRKT